MYELNKNGKLFASKFVGTGPSSYGKKNLPGRGLTKVEKQWSTLLLSRLPANAQFKSPLARPPEYPPY